MAMSDCVDCWDTPCTCGADWSTWCTHALRNHIERLEHIIASRPQGHDETAGWPRMKPADLRTPREQDEAEEAERAAQETRNERWRRF